jgi:hypothetical protein
MFVKISVPGGVGLARRDITVISCLPSDDAKTCALLPDVEQ